MAIAKRRATPTSKFHKAPGPDVGPTDPEATKRPRGRPRTIKEDWDRITIVLCKRHVRAIRRYVKSMAGIRRGKQRKEDVVTVAGFVRAMAHVLDSVQIDVQKVWSERRLTRLFVDLVARGSATDAAEGPEPRKTTGRDRDDRRKAKHTKRQSGPEVEAEDGGAEGKTLDAGLARVLKKRREPHAPTRAGGDEDAVPRSDAEPVASPKEAQASTASTSPRGGSRQLGPRRHLGSSRRKLSEKERKRIEDLREQLGEVDLGIPDLVEEVGVPGPILDRLLNGDHHGAAEISPATLAKVERYLKRRLQDDHDEPDDPPPGWESGT